MADQTLVGQFIGYMFFHCSAIPESVEKIKIFYRHACGVVGLALFISSLRCLNCCSRLLLGEVYALHAMNRGKNVIRSEQQSLKYRQLKRENEELGRRKKNIKM